MKLHLLFGNVWGLNNPHKRELVKYWLRSWNCYVVCLQEMKLDGIDLQLMQILWGNSFVDWEVLPAIGTAEGVVLLWDRHVLEKLDCVVSQFYVSCLWKGVSDGLEWVGTDLYGPTNNDLQRELWVELSNVRQK
jgi:hypothetical protein